MQKQVISWLVLLHTISQPFTNMDLALSREGNRNGQRNQAIQLQSLIYIFIYKCVKSYKYCKYIVINKVLRVITFWVIFNI